MGEKEKRISDLNELKDTLNDIENKISSCINDDNIDRLMLINTCLSVMLSITSLDDLFKYISLNWWYYQLVLRPIDIYFNKMIKNWGKHQFGNIKIQIDNNLVLIIWHYVIFYHIIPNSLLRGNLKKVPSG